MPMTHLSMLSGRGALHITHPGEYVLLLDSDSSATVALDGRIILSHDRPRVTIAPAVGLHVLRVHSRVEDADGVLRVLWQPPPPPPIEGEEPSPVEDIADLDPGADLVSQFVPWRRASCGTGLGASSPLWRMSMRLAMHCLTLCVSHRELAARSGITLS